MLTRLAVGALGAVFFAQAADSILLKDDSAITGRILAEKRDKVFVDIGYTVVEVPRSEISRILKSKPGEKPPATPAAVKAKDKPSTPPAAGAPAAAATAAPAGPKPLYASGAGAGAEKSVREWAAQLGESVVQVRTPGGLGSGFFLSEDGFLVTNFHVIEGETQISVEVYHQRSGQLERRSYKQVRIVALNKFDDLALLKIEDTDAPRFAKTALGQTEGLAVGEKVFAIGSPLGLERTVTEGIVSTKTRLIQGELYLQTTAPINPGNSGGPLFNLRGEVVGVTNMKMTFGEGLAFAIPVEGLRYFLDHRDAFAYDNDNPSNAYRYLEPPRRLSQIPTR